MDFIKQKFKKYFILLAFSYVVIRILVELIMAIDPDLLTFEHSSNSTTYYSDDFLVYGLTLLTNIIFAILVYYDLKARSIKSIPILFLTVCSSLFGIILFLLAVFVNDFENLTSNDSNI